MMLWATLLPIFKCTVEPQNFILVEKVLLIFSAFENASKPNCQKVIENFQYQYKNQIDNCQTSYTLSPVLTKISYIISETCRNKLFAKKLAITHCLNPNLQTDLQ